MTSAKIKPPKLDLKNMGRRIRQIRGFDLSQAQFGDMLGIRQNMLSNYENGRTVAPLEILVKLKAHSGKSIDWIVFGEETTSPR